MLFIQSKTCFVVTTSVVAIFFICCLSSTQSVDTYEGKCEQGTTNDGRVLDTCDPQKFLKCFDSRCRCSDQTNQIWTYRKEKVSSSSRSRRSPKKGGGSKGGGSKGKIAAGVVAGAAGGYLASSVINSGNRGVGVGSSSSSNGKKDNTQKIYGCYTRVHGECLLPGNEQGITIHVVPVNSSTTPAPLPVTITVPTNNTATDNATTTTTSTTAASAPQALAQVSYSTEFVRLPKCVEHSTCKPAEVKIVNGSVVSGFRDSRLGVCQCEDGYKSNNQDLCVKSGAGLLRSEMSVFVLLVSLLISKWL